MENKSIAWLILGFLSVGCSAAAADPLLDSAAHDAEALSSSCKPELIQPGVAQNLLAVTEDDYAVYQEGQTVYATKLERHAQRIVVGQVQGTNVAFPLQVGREVFVWLDPQRNLPGFGVSPLVLFTSARGAQLISSSSAVGLVATAASLDDRQIVFTTNVTPDGLSGDLVQARTRDALSPTTLLASIPLNFPGGVCRPLAGFAGPESSPYPVAAYCAGTDTTGTLSKWQHGRKTDLISNIKTPMPFTLEMNPQRTTFLVNLADSRVVTVTDQGKVSTVDNVLGVRGFVNRHGNVVYSTRGAAGLELKVAHHGGNPESVSPLAVLYSNRWNRSGYYQSRTSSLDGSLALFATILDPVFFFLGDMNLLDVNTGETVTLEPGLGAIPGSEIFTSDSKHALYLLVSDPNVGTGPLMSANLQGAHQVGTSATVWDVFRADGSTVTFQDNVDLSDPDFFQWSGDLYAADANDPHATPRLISAQANLLYLPSEDRRRVIFQSKGEADGPGLYVASARR